MISKFYGCFQKKLYYCPFKIYNFHYIIHDIIIEYFGGRPHAIRGDVNVKNDGSHKTLTEIDFESAFSPVKIMSRESTDISFAKASRASSKS